MEGPRGSGHAGEDVSADIVRRIRSGDEAAWEDLYLRCRDPLLLSIRCRLGSRLRGYLTSEDVLQSVLRDALAELPSFEHRHAGALRHYLHVCALNKIRRKAEHHGALKRSGEVPLSDSVIERMPSRDDGGPGYLDAERYERVERALARLPETMREVVLLRLVEGLSNREAAEVLGKSPEAASKAFNRALARLGTLVGDEP